MSTTIRDHLTGIHTREQLARLTWPIAWSPFKAPADAAEEEGALADLAAEARDALDADPDAVAVEIIAGQVVATVRDAARAYVAACEAAGESPTPGAVRAAKGTP